MVFIRKVWTPPRPSPQKTRPAKEPPRSPATSTSAQAVPSGKERLPCSFTMSWRLSGTMKGERENPPKGEFRTEAEKDQGGDGEHDACGERFAGRAGGLDDVILEDGGAAEGAKNTDG